MLCYRPIYCDYRGLLRCYKMSDSGATSSMFPSIWEHCQSGPPYPPLYLSLCSLHWLSNPRWKVEGYLANVDHPWVKTLIAKLYNVIGSDLCITNDSAVEGFRGWLETKAMRVMWRNWLAFLFLGNVREQRWFCCRCSEQITFWWCLNRRPFRWSSSAFGRFRAVSSYRVKDSSSRYSTVSSTQM